MPDYQGLLDDEILAFLARSEEIAPKADGLSVAQRRENFDRLWESFSPGLTPGVDVADETWGGVSCRRYESGPCAATVVYYHGGGWVVGGLDSHDDVCSELCARTGFRVIAVDYGLAPEHIFPRCFEDARAAFEAIAAGFDGPVVLAGDSAGGSLAAAVSHAARPGPEGRIAGQVLIYPVLGLATAGQVPVAHADAPGLTQADMRFYYRTRCGGPVRPGDARLAPLEDVDFAGLPPTVIVTAEFDPLAAEGSDYCAALAAAGVPVTLVEERGLVHGFLRARPMSRKARASFDRIVAATRSLGMGDWPIEGP